jgi:hypothetical protein
MAPSDRIARAQRRARFAYEHTHVMTALRGLALAGGLTIFAYGLHRTSSVTWLVAGALGLVLAGFGWRGGAWRRGALAGVIAGLPPLIAPSVMFAVTRGNHCATCEQGAGLACTIVCFGAGSLVGIVVGHRAVIDRAPRPFVAAAIASAALTGMLSCGTTGLGGAIGVGIGLIAGGLTGWVFATRAAHA